MVKAYLVHHHTAAEGQRSVLVHPCVPLFPVVREAMT